ncbi:MAG: hypothetical protein Q4A34_02970 [Candidatus Saccharibacteria bacterium]|nr:hypothetical protein [Candidatus Saccharibacteria bacterium]
MGIIVNQQDGRSKLQEKIAAELREKAKKTNLPEREVVDGVEDVAYLNGTKQTTSLAGAWLFIVIATAVVIGMLLMQG